MSQKKMVLDGKVVCSLTKKGHLKMSAVVKGPRDSSAASSSTAVAIRQPTPPSPQQLEAEVASGARPVHTSKKRITAANLHTAVRGIQRRLTLTAGVNGTWSDKAEQALADWLLEPKNACGRKPKSKGQPALEDGEVDHDEEQDEEDQVGELDEQEDSKKDTKGKKLGDKKKKDDD
jgi:hypothetical protein